MPTGMGGSKEAEAAKAPSLGVIRLDYDYPPIVGDIDHADSFDYDVYYKVVPGLTFEMCMEGDMTEEVRERFLESIRWLIQTKHVNVITGDCGFMVNYQKLAQAEAEKLNKGVPIVMSSLVMSNLILSSLGLDEVLMVLTADGEKLRAIKDVILDLTGCDTESHRIQIVGCQDVPGFEAVINGDKVVPEIVEPGVADLVKKKIRENPRIKAILIECTELPRYANAFRKATALPVFDTVTCCNTFIDGFREEHKYGKRNWQQKWDHVQEDYQFGQNLNLHEYKDLENKPEKPPPNKQIGNFYGQRAVPGSIRPNLNPRGLQGPAYAQYHHYHTLPQY